MGKIKPLFFWLNPIKEIVWDPFWWVFLMFVILWVPFLRVWWWFFLPVFLSIQLEILYLWWIGWDFSYSKTKWIMLEIIPPKEVLVPFKAMEDVFSVVWGIWDSGNWRERWFEGETETPYWLSWEIASIEGQVHFYARVRSEHKTMVESVLYSHFPELEIAQVPDYTKSVPQNIPNQEWDMYGEDFVFRGGPACLPIKTYEKFFEPQGEKISAEEKRIDPMISFLESMSKLGPGEQFWFQLITIPILDSNDNWRSVGKKAINKISRRAEKKEMTLWEDVMGLLYNLILGPQKEGSGEKATYKWVSQQKSEEGESEMILTPGEREMLTAIEDKMKKSAYRVAIRGMYVAKRENWRSPHKAITRPYFTHFATEHMNKLVFTGDTRPKVHYLMRKRRPYVRARKMFKNAVARFPAAFPDVEMYLPILNTEELATIFHFPIKVTGLVAPTMTRVESKKGGPPPNLPM